jgi:hypothetical protein
MPLIDCPECGLAVSAQATFCPRCGFPVKKAGSRHAGDAARGMAEIPLTSLDVTKSLIGRLVFGGLVLACGIGFDAPPVVMLALVAWGSGIPLYLKARKAARLGATPAAGALDPSRSRTSSGTRARSPISRSGSSSWSVCSRGSARRAEPDHLGSGPSRPPPSPTVVIPVPGGPGERGRGFLTPA